GGFHLEVHGTPYPLDPRTLHAHAPRDAAGLADFDPATDAGRQRLHRLLEHQHYRLAWWRVANDELNWRRFFTISDLAGLRIEDAAVFEATHALYFRLYGDGLIDGVRVDHVDGLTDPAGYCRTLRQRLDAIERPAGAPAGPAYLVIEKILGAGEPLSQDWGVDGTSGYDFMEQVAAVLHDPDGEGPLDTLWEDFSGRLLGYADEELQARQDMLSWSFEGQLAACTRAFAALAASAPATARFTHGMLRRAITRLLWVFPVYRTYGNGTSAPEGDTAVREQVRQAARRFTPPGEAEVADAILAWLAGEGPGDAALAAEAVRRFQQLSAPIAAKAVEDTAFYRYGRLLSRTDVGFDPAVFASSPAAFHAACEARAIAFPHAMLTTATHDHKRGEDMRARLAVLSAIPERWREAVCRWDGLADGPAAGVDPADRYMLYQTLFGAWPDGLAPDDGGGLRGYAERLTAWQQKALREAKLRSSWEQPDTDYEERAAGFLTGLCNAGGDVVRAVHDFVAATAGATRAAMLAQVALRYTTPGVPDLYQGTELADLSLVDPDNRRPVDFSCRTAMLVDGASAKFALIRELLRLRREHAGLFADGHYIPASVEGPRAANLIAFSRTDGTTTLRCAVALRTGDPLFGRESTVPSSDWWSGTRIFFHDGDDGDVFAAELFAGDPVSVRLHR
ncbi:MAG: malto-oligosyltrehalose synthase, partial [Sphingomonas sp.]